MPVVEAASRTWRHGARFAMPILGLLSGALVTGGTAVTTAGPQDGLGSRSTSDGVFTTTQAVQGRQQYDVFCVQCHGPELEGGGVDIPALMGDKFVQKWSKRPLLDLFDLIKRNMPENDPGSLTDAAYAEVLAFLLQENGYPSGATALASDREQLGNIDIGLPRANAR
jgi:mono/diheme cytochrome c family protein